MNHGNNNHLLIKVALILYLFFTKIFIDMKKHIGDIVQDKQ